MIEVLSSGALNLVQDLGRQNCMHMGVSASGAMDAPALRLANWLIGNDAGAAGLELSVFPFRMRFEGDISFCCTGAHCRITLDDQPIPNWTKCQARAGQRLVIESPLLGVRAYLAFEGGIDVPEILGSRSTDLKGGFGGHEGRGVKRGDHLNVSSTTPHIGKCVPVIAPYDRLRLKKELANGCVSVRVLPAAEFGQFTEAAIAAFYSTPYEVTPQANRVGYRLKGTPLHTCQRLELRSHGIAPGTVQVPPAGQPIVQLAEANTCGGYPKIATVIESDLWRLAQTPVGCAIQFIPVTSNDGATAIRDHWDALGLVQCRLASRFQA
ncbi:biotin-dependent carboxyltransferase family protein [Pseudomonas fluorescens]|uniref:Carboxyltransferase domain-containing protein n=1 Tax=Pseudomonas fluorescens TaxID=294 RepID=A0A5E7DYI1_PSEFL|nr:biotin-dependent carboxyltransferase family protein [Pseudomonas fluorescens]VVO19358.1 putative protein YbgK [Pseudomonas fluorescens]